ncbi:MAG: M23 family metallopeptidase [Prevotella sp.]|nr:M23 family metallopeptidase [Candidatus Prevotella equi]
MRKILYILLLLTIATSTFSKEEFSPLEQQQISISTPGLFSHSNAFQVDFSQLPATSYSFPLPVGKATATSGNEVEIETKKGDAVKAMFDGTVRLSRNNPPYGNVIVIRHNNGLETVYALNAQNMVKSGDRVKAGQTIAIVGGQVGRVYCLFSIMVDGRRINPSTILNVGSHNLHKQVVTIRKVGNRIEVKTQRNTTAKEGKQEPVGMSMDTNDPFQGNATYRLNLDAIKPSAWHYPLENAHVISGYGGKRKHSGVDIKNGPGTNVYAAFDGQVIQSGVFSGYGKCITIRHANGLETRYSHNSKNFVVVGEKVKAGQVIGIVGRTGRATTEHVHFETRIAGRAFDPSYVFDHSRNRLQTGTLQFKKNGGVVRLAK